MKPLSLEQLLELHALVVVRTGGGKGLRDLGRLEAALATQTQTVFDTPLYPSVFEKAAALMRGILSDHPFVDGDKRTGLLAGLTLLRINGFDCTAAEGEIEAFAVQIVTDRLDVPAIAAWLRAHTTPS